MQALLLIWLMWKEYFQWNYEYGCACFSCLSKWPTGDIVKRAICSCLRNPKFFNGNFYKLGEWLYHLYEFHLNWFKCRWEPDAFIFTSWEWIFWSKHRRLADAIKCSYYGNDTSADQNMVVFVYPPGNLPPHKKWRGVKIFHFQLCFTFLENCS